MAGNVRRAFDKSVREAAKVSDAEFKLQPNLDAALIAAGRGIADHLDNMNEALIAKLEELAEDATPEDAIRIADAVERLAQRVDKAVYLTPHLMNILREMYATPKSRVDGKAARAKSEKQGPTGTGKGTLGKLQGLAGGKTA